MTSLVSKLCATVATVAASANLLAEGQRCCERLSETKYLPLVSNQQYAGELLFGTDTFEFPEGYSPIAAFELPASGAKRLAFAARLTGFGRSRLHMLCPTFTFLDSNYEALASIEPALRYEANFFSGGKYRAQIDIAPEARFVVLHTSTATIGRRLAASEVPSQGFVYPMGKGLGYVPGPPGLEAYPCANLGKFELEAR